MYKTLKERYRPERQWPANSTEPFPMEGDILMLQFVNTFRNRSTGDRKDLLHDYECLLAWCCEFGIISHDEYQVLELEGRCYEHEAAVVWQRAVKLRESMHQFIYSPMRGREIHEVDLFYFNELVNDANAHIRFELDNNRPRQAWTDMEEQLAAPLWKLVKHAVDLVNSKAFDYVKKCQCGNVYLDTTHGKNRRWCNPLTCGQTARMKTYRKRRQEGEGVKENAGEPKIMNVEIVEPKCVGQLA
ncbi:MAG: CGNR zinc finger domain-containing protein [Mucilaginibacter sp.]